MAAARFVVSGKVQGVFFRASTRDRARQLGLRGHARNLPNGDVEVLAAGDAQALQSLEDWLRVGPSQARVDGMLREPIDEHTLAGQGFDVG